MKYTRRRQLLHALKFHMLDKATDRVKGPGMTGFTPEQKHQMRMNKAGHKVPIHAGRSRRKTRGRRRKTRGGDDNKPRYRNTNPEYAPEGQGAPGTAVLLERAALLQEQAKPASTPAVGGPSPGASTPPPPTPSFSSFLGPSRSLGVRQLVNNFLPKASPSQENPQDVARWNWCDANYEVPADRLQCYQEAPDDVSDTKPWLKNKRAGRRRITRRR